MVSHLLHFSTPCNLVTLVTVSTPLSGLQTLQHDFNERLRFLNLDRLIARTPYANGDVDVTFEHVQFAAEAARRPEGLVSKTGNFLRSCRLPLLFFACIRLFFVAVENFLPRLLRIARVRPVGSRWRVKLRLAQPALIRFRAGRMRNVSGYSRNC
jgi:hypothetical protein